MRSEYAKFHEFSIHRDADMNISLFCSESHPLCGSWVADVHREGNNGELRAAATGTKKEACTRCHE
jgi:hypothetical protein